MSAPSSPHEYAIVVVVVVVVAVIFVVEDALFEKHVRLGPNGASVSSHTLVVVVVVVVVVQAYGGETDVVGVELAVVDMVDIAAPWIGILRLLILAILAVAAAAADAAVVPIEDARAGIVLVSNFRTGAVVLPPARTRRRRIIPIARRRAAVVRQFDVVVFVVVVGGLQQGEKGFRFSHHGGGVVGSGVWNFSVYFSVRSVTHTFT
jgi:hypothetical protein